jgi:hypothetical protein
MATKKKSAKKGAKKKSAKKPASVKKVVKKAAKKIAPKAVKKVRCAAKTKDGKRCKNYAVGKSKYCKVHQKKR